jgi:hypothetical protein
MFIRRTLSALLMVFVFWTMLLLPAHSQETGVAIDKEAAKLVGRWVIVQTKEPGKPYTDGYKGQIFVAEGPNAFSLILEYRKDGTFRRLSRIGQKEKVIQGKWVLSGHELRHKREGSSDDEVMYIRFDSPESFTYIEVYEATRDPGLFARFKRLN